MVYLLFLSAVFSKAATFSALYAFGDGACTTTASPNPPSLYYGNRFSNGRVWIEVLAQRQGLPYIASNNDSYFGQYSQLFLNAVNSFVPPTNVSTALFVIWVCDADSVEDMENINPLTSGTMWTNAMNQSLTNQFNAVQILYNKGVHTIVMPNAVDITEIPEFNQTAPSTRSFVRAQLINYNVAFAAGLKNLAATNHGLKIYVPDVFSLLDNVLTNSAGYGMTNVLSGGQNIDAIDAGYTSFTSPGANYIFWDPFDPTARLHEVIADYVQNIISPPKIASITMVGASNQLSVVNFPAGLNGYADFVTNITSTNWQPGQFFTNSGTSAFISVPASGAQQYFRLRFPYAWYWP